MGCFKIFPPIGIARVGNSEQFYLAPEEPIATDNKKPHLLSLPIPLQLNGNKPTLPITESGSSFEENDFRDNDGKMCRQGVRFRIYYYAGDETEPQEVKIGEQINNKTVNKITWKVRIANKKASWYKFLTNNGEDGYAPNHPLRNGSEENETNRQNQLILAPDCQSLDTSTDTQNIKNFTVSDLENLYPTVDGFTVNNQTIESLGEIYLDTEGRLVFVGGYGRSGSINDPPQIKSYANNDDWFDDTSDGPVLAQVHLDGENPITVEYPAWVIVAPPAHAPQIPHMVTLYDTMFDTAVRHLNFNTKIYNDGYWDDKYKPSWQDQIKPILDRASLTTWVTAMPPKPHTFDYDKLANIDPKYNGLRQYFFSQMRPPNQKNTLKSKTTGYPMMPYLAGDDATTSSENSSKYLTLTDTQYFFLQQWANGKFDPGNSEEPKAPDTFTMASLEACVGGAFSPGIEMTWICRNPKLYQEPFRIKHKYPYNELDNKPLSLGLNWDQGFEPGDVTRYMAVPWQADFDVCTAQSLDRIVWWWPAQRPLFVYLKPDDIEGDTDENTDYPDETIKNKQVAWVGSSYDQNADDYLILGYLEMVEKWHKLGFVFDINQNSSVSNWDGPYFAEVQRPKD
ncbi:MAG: hypothetical protein F6K58_14770 [Symploca sp. SIO2E9]|nr:hypothetical protein [Symploca sp. SIO2E9]